ncbi:MAG: M48 family metallopeptidase, partial [Treponema sp.]|nr:M48 family metallopeptidase [Treponema sp.]
MKKVLPVVLSTLLAVSLTSCMSSGELASFIIGEIIDDTISRSIGGDTYQPSVDYEEIITSNIINVTTTLESMEDEYSPENNYYLGRCVAASIEDQYPLYTDAPITTAYLNYICNAIVINSDQPTLYKGYFVGIMDTDEINAMATPGGHIFVSKGLIRAVDSEDALAAVIAHEIGHIQCEHSITAIKANRTTEVSLQALGNVVKTISIETARNDKNLQMLGISGEEFSKVFDSLATSVNSAVSTLVNTGFSRDQEFEADNKALELMNNAGYDVGGMRDM